jgi:hypothetical protein
VELSTTSAPAIGAVETETEEIQPEILAVIAATATALLGKNFRLSSVSRREQVSKWTRQGRASVQASHNLRPKR